MALSIGRAGRGYRPRIEVYTRERCTLCRKAERLVAEEARRGADVHLIDVDEDPELKRRYDTRVPVIVVDGREVAEGQIQPGTVARAIRRARRGRWSQWRRA